MLSMMIALSESMAKKQAITVEASNVD